MALRPEIKGPWVKALRSDEYEQCGAHLERGDGTVPSGKRHCCLGVLLVVLGNTDGVHHAKVPTNGFDSAVDGEELSAEMCDYLGISAYDMYDLASRNDGKDGYTAQDFNTIADHIEKNL